MPHDITPNPFRVPRDDRSLLSIPRLEKVLQLVEENRQLFALDSCSLHGRTLADLRIATRRETLAAARTFTSSISQTELEARSSESFIVTGHQPELFHVGVWAKNFATAGIAQQSRAVPLNLVIDNDTINGTSIRIPAGTRDVMRADHLLFDAPRPTQPWEEATIRDHATFERFGSVVRDVIRETWGFDPLIGSSWDAAVRQMSVSRRLCDALTALRAHVERKWGQNNLELPMSRLCETEPFLWFTADLLMRLPEFHAIYNETVGIYRQEHRLRNRRQPVPDLEQADGWFEAPFWIWQQGDLQRGRLFARQTGSICELRDENEIFARLPLSGDGPLHPAIDILKELPARGFRLRSRALTTTLFARVFLADLFVHGIGGAKYDAMTDQLCERFYGLKAPQFLTVSATLHLPLGDAFSTTDVQLRDINHKIRDLTYNPDRHLHHLPAAASLIAEKRDLLEGARKLRESQQLRGKLNSHQHRRLEAIRVELQSHTGALRSEYESQRMAIRAQLSANALIRNREYAFALYPEEQVRQFLLPLARI